MVLPHQKGPATPFKKSEGQVLPPPPSTAPLPSGANRGSGKLVLSHSLENVEESGKLVLGLHPAFIEYVEEVFSRNGNQGIKFHLRFISFTGVEAPNPNEGRKGTHAVYLTEKALWKVKNSFCAVGQCDAISEFDMDAAEGVLVMVDVVEDDYLPEGQSVARKVSRCESIIAWPLDFGGPGTKFQAAR